MRPPQVTVKRMMLAVVVVAIALGWYIDRRHRFQKLATYHKEQSGTLGLKLSGGVPVLLITGPDGKLLSVARYEWHRSLSDKYRRASLRPWLPVSADPPKP